jgi:hypothetical protein
MLGNGFRYGKVLRIWEFVSTQGPELVDLFFGITTRLILHRGFVQRLVSPYAVGLSMRNYSEIY